MVNTGLGIRKSGSLGRWDSGRWLARITVAASMKSFWFVDRRARSALLSLAYSIGGKRSQYFSVNGNISCRDCNLFCPALRCMQAA